MKNIFASILSFLLLFCSLNASAQFGWVSQPSGTTQNLNSIWANNAFSVYTVGNAGAARKTSNKGTTWAAMPLGSVLTHNSIKLDGTVGYIVGAGQEILQTTNAGNSWSSIGVGTTTLNDFFFTNGAGGWVVGDQEAGYGFLYNSLTNQLFLSSDLANKALRGIYLTNLSDGFVVGDGGLILRTNNGGNYWFKVTSGTAVQLNKVVFINTTTGIVVGNSGTILKTTDSGSTWTRLTSGTTANLNAVYFPDANNIFICGDNGTIIYSNNGGISWQTEPTGTNEKLNSIQGDGISDIWACGNNGTILYRTQITGLSEDTGLAKAKVHVYPNPVTEQAILTVSGLSGKGGSVSIYNIMGQHVQDLQFTAEQPVTLKTSALTFGTYFYKVLDKAGAGLASGKFVVLH